MDVIEKAIRSAFDKGTPDDRAFRERVYRQAFAALDRALQANPGSTVENAIARRRQLQATIVDIESEFIPAVHAATPGSDQSARGQGGAPDLASARSGPSAGSGAAGAMPRDAGVLEVPYPDPRAPEVRPHAGPADLDDAPSIPPVVSPRTAPDGGRQPEFSLDDFLVEPPPADVLPDLNLAVERVPPASTRAPAVERSPGGYDPRLRQRRGSFRGAVVILLLVTMIGGLGWWAMQQGLLELPAGRNTGEVRTPPDGQAEDFVPEEPGTPPPLGPVEAAPERTWITLFEPADPTRVSAPADASAEVMQDESGSFLRIRSGSSGSAVAFDVGQGVLEQLSGKKAVFDIVARAEGGGQTEMSVDCNFGEFGDCGRKRYAVGYERGEYLFEVEFPATDPGAGGTIAVNSDFAGQGRAIDIYEIRVAAE